MFNMTLAEVKQLALNQYQVYLTLAINLLSAYRQGEVDMAYKNTKENKLRDRLKQLRAEAEARENSGGK
jgi:hypothetical protein